LRILFSPLLRIPLTFSISNNASGVAPHYCNPSYSGGRDQEDCSLKPDWANSSSDLILKNPFTKRAGGVAQGVGPEFKLQHQKKKKKNDNFLSVQFFSPRELECGKGLRFKNLYSVRVLVAHACNPSYLGG
jgi:hypothetical protein